MLKKFIGVKNVGRFINSAHTGVPECAKTVLILGGNGFGKTTLAAILRSLGSNAPAIVMGRKRIGSTAAPEIDLLLTGAKATFRNGAWSSAASDIIVFDETFIAENVHAGNAVDIEQRRNLYRVIVGKEGVGLVIEEERLAGESRTTGSDIKAAEKAIQTHIPVGMTLDDFLKLPVDPDTEAKITAQVKSIEAVRAAERLKTRAPLSPVRFPALPANLEALLGKALDGIAADAQDKIAKHIARHRMGDDGESWLEQGIDRIVDDACPYCGQSTKGLALIEAYRRVFGDAYREAKVMIESTIETVERDFGARVVGALNTQFEANLGTAEFWSAYCKLPPIVAPQNATTAISALGDAALALLRKKVAAPQEAVALSPAFTAALRQYHKAAATIDGYNSAITAANAEIATKKAAVESGDLKKEEATLIRLNAQKKRHEPMIARLCAERQALVTAKDGFDKQKVNVREKLEKHTDNVIKPYEGRINQLLDNFNAGFRITRTKPAYAGGVASSTYQLVINETPIDIGDGKTPITQPSFKNTLSAGDRNTLALAVFVAHLERDPELTKRIVVFDDPFTSQDSFRRRQTVNEIARIGKASQQLIVLSHDATFLQQIRDKSTGETAALQLVDHRSLGIKIAACDLDATTRGRAASDMDDLQTYVTTGAGKDRDVVRKMRIVLETYCRSTYSGSFQPTDMLGTIVERIRDVGETHPVWAIVEELDQINEYSRDHHHGEDPQDSAADLIDAAELTGFVRRTLRIVNNLQA